jgi:hypothetical protein
MGNSLTSSIVRGFGFTIGRRAANSVLDSASQPKVGGMSSGQQWKSIGLYVLGIIIASNISTGAGIGFFFLGWIPAIMIVKYLANNKAGKECERIISQIDQMVEESRSIGMEGLEGWESAKSNIKNNEEGLGFAKQYLNLTERMISIFKNYRAKYDLDMTKRMLAGKPWTGMTKQHVKDMQGSEPTKEEYMVENQKEQDVFIYGNKQSGSVFKFENDLLVAFTSR